jgi:hypothetical protein
VPWFSAKKSVSWRIWLNTDKGQFEQRQERRLMRFEDFGKLCRTKPRRFHGQCVWRFKAEL